ncbi:hypothetical protein MKX03_014303 [Papaver bracteatum]|nr:hypothetical protein MKX03_014303 [Papaver bracteatum]
MVRPYTVKGGVKRKKREEICDDTEIEATISTLENNTYKEEQNEIDTEETTMDTELDGIPIAPFSYSDNKSKYGIVFVLERASLEVSRVGKVILRNSLLNKAEKLQDVYVKTEKGVLFEVKPHCRMPRNFKRFCGIMVQLLQKLSITATGKRENLLRVIDNRVKQHLPLNSRRIGLSYSSLKLVQLRDYVNTAGDDMNLVFVVGAMYHGKINNDSTDDIISGK